MGDRIRAFLALELPRAAVRLAGDVIGGLRDRLGDDDVKWVRPQNLHVTLRFFGDILPAEVEGISERVRAYPERLSAVATAWRALGAFPSERRPQVLWLGLADPQEALVRLASEVTRDLEETGFGRPDKPFRAHVTLGRVRRGARVQMPGSDDLTIPQAPFSISAIALIRSRLTPRGPVYTPIETAHLQE